MSDDVADTLARWAQRDAAIGLDAELNETRIAVASRDEQIVDLRERNQRLAQRVAQLVTERDGLARQITSLQRPSQWRTIGRRIASLATRLSRRGT